MQYHNDKTGKMVFLWYSTKSLIINQAQYTVLVTVVIGSAVIPSLIAQKWFFPRMAPPLPLASVDEFAARDEEDAVLERGRE